MDKVIITELDRHSFIETIKNNNGLFIVKFTATWCGPCKKIAPFVDEQFKNTPDIVTCANIDVDQNFDLFAFLKSKKMVKGVPVILAYKKENTNYSPDFSVSGIDEEQLIVFFRNCVNYIRTIQ
jgi:thioredoxin 1